MKMERNKIRRKGKDRRNGKREKERTKWSQMKTKEEKVRNGLCR